MQLFTFENPPLGDARVVAKPTTQTEGSRSTRLVAEDERRISDHIAMTAGDCVSDDHLCSVWLDRLSERRITTTTMATLVMTDAQLRGFARQVIKDYIAATRNGVVPCEEGQLLTTRQALERLQVSRPTLERMATAGEIKRMKVRGSWRYTTTSIDEYLAS